MTSFLPLRALLLLFLARPPPTCAHALIFRQFPEEEELREALKSQGEWNPQVLAVLAVPLVRDERGQGLRPRPGLGYGMVLEIKTSRCARFCCSGV